MGNVRSESSASPAGENSHGVVDRYQRHRRLIFEFNGPQPSLSVSQYVANRPLDHRLDPVLALRDAILLQRSCTSPYEPLIDVSRFDMLVDCDLIGVRLQQGASRDLSFHKRTSRPTRACTERRPGRAGTAQKTNHRVQQDPLDLCQGIRAALPCGQCDQLRRLYLVRGYPRQRRPVRLHQHDWVRVSDAVFETDAYRRLYFPRFCECSDPSYFWYSKYTRLLKIERAD